jgi:hypothetical protein
VFIANGDSDPMILPHFSYLLAGLIPQARIKIYPDAAHGFLFQHASEFASDVRHSSMRTARSESLRPSTGRSFPLRSAPHAKMHDDRLALFLLVRIHGSPGR